ncbi:MAG: MmgE/PrpD family protein [Coriobacteriia bacterium]|nr:MmgE/PrpD family protein [Coriobacteriia bacterium]
MNVTEQVCKHLVETGFDSIDAKAIARAKVRILDSLGVIAAGARAPGCGELVELATRWGGQGESTVLVHGLKVPAHNAAMVNSMMMRSFDFEAIEAEGENHTSSAAHISGTTVPVALAVAEKQRASGKELLAALALGDDLTARLGSASGFDVYGGWDNTGTMNALGATAVAGRLLGLNTVQLDQALGIVENQLSGVIDNIDDKTMSFKLPMCLSARNAIFSAEFAQMGFTAMRDAIGGSHGFFKMYCGNPDPEKLMRGLGEIYYADCVIKPWSACRATHPAINACVEIVTQNSVDVEDIEAVVIHVTPRTLKGFVGQPFEMGDTPQISGAFSIRFASANAILRKTVRPEHFAPEMMNQPELTALLDKITLVDSLEPAEYLTANVEVKMKDGAVYFARTEVPKGDIFKNPMSYEEIVDKYRLNLKFTQTISDQVAEEAKDLVENMEELNDIGKLISLFGAK